MNGDFWIINSRQTLENLLDWLVDAWNDKKYMRVKITFGKTRTMSQNDLFHLWCRQGAKFFKLKGMGKITPEEQMKLVFKSMFLGVEDVQVTDKTIIQGQLRETSRLDVGEMHDFMTQVQAWMAEKGCPLESCGEFQELRDGQ